jgi:hypothetical protein
VAARAQHRGAEDASDVVQQVAVAVSQSPEQGRGRLDIGHQEGDESGGERRGIGRRGLDLAVHQLLLDDEAHGCEHGLCEARIVEDRRVVHERRHRPALTLEEGHATRVSLGRKRNGLARAVEIRAGRVGPVQDGEGRITEDAAQALFELTGGRVLPQLDDEAAGRRVSPLRLELPGDEADGYDAVLLRRIQEAYASALAGGLVLEGDLGESGQGVPHVRLVVDRQPPPAARVHVGESAGGEAGPFARSQSRHASTITRFALGRERRITVPETRS